jgi:hypothetical protein
MAATIVDVNNVLLQLGAVQVTGFADGEAFSFDFDGVDFEAAGGSHGEVTVVRKHNNIGTGTFRTMQGSVLNAILHDLHNASVLAGGTSFVFTFKDLRGSTNINGAQAILEKHAKQSWGDTANPREWTVKIFNPNTTGGLNVSV